MKPSSIDILDLLTRRPDLSVADVERLLRQQQTPPKQAEPLTKIQKRLRRCLIIVVVTTVLTLFAFFLSGAPWERGPGALISAVLWLIVNMGLCAATSDYE